MRQSLIFTCALVCLFAAALTVRAQDRSPERSYAPGDLVTFSLAFDGHDVAQIDQVRIGFRAQSPAPSDQQTFEVSFFGGQSARLDENKFEANIRVPVNVATGDYDLYLVRATSKPPLTLTLGYEGGDLPKRTIRIRNPAHFIKPTIKDAKEVSKP
jgi:hypothetical protein